MAYRIRKAPLGRRDTATFYALSGGKLHWSSIREVATQFPNEDIAAHVANRIRQSNGKLAMKITVEPC